MTTTTSLVAKNIRNLIPDIYATINSDSIWFSNEHSSLLGNDISRRLEESFGEVKRRGTLRLSKMGPTCPRALWYSVHKPEEAEALPAWVKIKFSYGHILEALAITLAKAAGHKVEGEQDELIVDGVKGHRDCVIDGCVVDVKSASTRSFQKFKDGTLKEEDLFGYLDQLDAYLVGSREDPLVTVKDRGYLLAIDKTLGHLALYEHRLRETHIRNRVAEHKRIVGLPAPPACSCGVVEYGKSGNLALDTRASYSSYKYACFPNLRTFIYSKGPVYLTHVTREPESYVPEIDKDGNYIPRKY